MFNREIHEKQLRREGEHLKPKYAIGWYERRKKVLEEKLEIIEKILVEMRKEVEES